jgi:GNAT superfamily N-acetyltransferase
MIIIREIKPEDYQATGDMIKSSIKESFRALYSEKLITEFCSKYDAEKFAQKADDTQLVVAEDEKEQKIAGVIGIKENQLRTFFVSPEQQGKGIGRLLFNELEKIARERGIKKLILEGSPLGEPIYEHFGFKKIGTIAKERAGEKYTDAVMEKSLI